MSRVAKRLIARPKGCAPLAEQVDVIPTGFGLRRQLDSIKMIPLPGNAVQQEQRALSVRSLKGRRVNYFWACAGGWVTVPMGGGVVGRPFLKLSNIVAHFATGRSA